MWQKSSLTERVEKTGGKGGRCGRKGGARNRVMELAQSEEDSEC